MDMFGMFLIEGVSTEAFNDTYHIAVTVVLGVISYFLLRLIKEHDKDKEKLDAVDSKVTEVVNDIKWIKRGLRRTGYRADQYSERDDVDDEREN